MVGARRLLALLLAVSTFGLAEVASAHGHAPSSADPAFTSAEAGSPGLGEGTPCVVCPGVGTWRAGGAPSASPAAAPPPPRVLRFRCAPAPLGVDRHVVAAGGPRAPPVSR